MINNKDEYETINNAVSKTNESVYLNPVFEGDDEATANLPLLDNSNNDDQSPYEEVAINISNKDDPTMLCLTFRSVFIGILLTFSISIIFQFFAYRTSPLDGNNGIVILLAYMMGKFVSKILPEKINPGPFSIKEHVLITIMATSGLKPVSIIETITVQRLYYDYYLSHFDAILFIIVLHLLTFSIAGILKRYLVWPAAMIWPGALMSCCLIRTLDAEDEMEKNKSRWTITRSTFFWLIVFLQLLWYWLPGYIFPLLSFFSFICMMAPNNIVFSQVTGANGLGLGAIQLDWSAWVAFLDSPILVPFWAHVNILIAFIVFIWIGTPIIYYSNVWESKKMPIISTRVFDIDGNFYNSTKVLNSNLRLNETAYETYGEVRMTAGFALSYCAGFAAFSAIIVHTVLYHGKTIVAKFRSSLSDKNNDIHAKLMSHYPDVSEGWYYLLLLLAFVLGLVQSYRNEFLSGYIIFLSIVLNLILVLPIGMITAITSLTFFLNIPADMISSLILPGNPIGYSIFRTYLLIGQSHILYFLAMFKIAHYMKIPPRVSFSMLFLSPLIAAIVKYITALYLLNYVPDICTQRNPIWKCFSVQNAYSDTILWGIIGSVKLFSPSSKYFSLLFAFIIGLFLPVISWCFWKKYPNVKWLASINFPIAIISVHFISPAPTAEFPSWFLVGFIFNYILYRYAHLWWEKYAYIFSAAMSCGVGICGFVIFLVFQNNNIYFPQWWGTGGITGDGCPLASGNYSGAIPTD